MSMTFSILNQSRENIDYYYYYYWFYFVQWNATDPLAQWFLFELTQEDKSENIFLYLGPFIRCLQFTASRKPADRREVTAAIQSNTYTATT